MNDDYYRADVFLRTGYVNWTIIMDAYNRQPPWNLDENTEENFTWFVTL